MEHSEYLEIEKQIDDLLDKIPIATTQILENLQRIKKQQETCSSSMIKTSLENTFQLGSALLVNYAIMVNKTIKYIKTTEEIYDIRHNSLVAYGNSIKDTIDSFVSLWNGKDGESIATYAEEQKADFSTLVKFHEHNVRSVSYRKLAIINLIYVSATVSDLILTENNHNENTEKAQSLSELLKAIVGFIPIIGSLMGLTDVVLAIKRIVKTYGNSSVLAPEIQTADEQLMQIEQQNTCLQKSLEVQQQISSFIDECLAQALAQKEAIECIPQ